METGANEFGSEGSDARLVKEVEERLRRDEFGTTGGHAISHCVAP